MREIKDKQLQYYCNIIGELHERGERMLDCVDELPQSLRRPYLDYWTDEWNLGCYIVFLDGQPGILLCAEYDDDYCQSQGIPVKYDAQYSVLFHYGERLEKLAHEINPSIIAGISYDSAHNPQIMLFIPTERVSLQDVPKLYYLMEQYGFQRAPDGVLWPVQELRAFVKQLGFTPEIERQMLDTLDTDIALGTPASDRDPMLLFMGLKIEKSKLYDMGRLLSMLDKCGGHDSALNQVRDTYTTLFGNQLIWKYPFSDNMQGGGVIIPVQEGFLFLPYSHVCSDNGALYQLCAAELLSAENIRTLQEECKSYVKGLLAALEDMELTIQGPTVKQYIDAQGNLYFVRAGLGGVFKGFRRYANPKPGQRRESGIRALNYVEDFGRAQKDLDQYAKKHHLQDLEDSGSKNGGEQDV